MRDHKGLDRQPSENPETESQSALWRPFDKLVILLFIAVGIYLFFSARRPVDWSGFLVFNTVFTSILMQAFPFMLIGILVSSALHVFVPGEFLLKLFPAKGGLGFVTALFAGIFFPVCECAIVPVVTRLARKGVSVPVAVTFMLAAPIINPIVIVSTLYAFPGQPEIALIRVGCGLAIALITGAVLHIFPEKSAVLLRQSDGHETHGHPAGHTACACGCCEHEHGDGHGKITVGAKLTEMLTHAGEEFFSVGKYLIIGALAAGLTQTLVPKDTFTGLTSQSGLSLLIMMAAAFLFSACSTSDAFIARSFQNRFTPGAVLGFMVFGPMMDIKNLLMLFSGFKKSFVLKLAFLIFALNFIVLYALAPFLR
jgi:uncharacterized membrane protein YraQ (UPF0718 family)